MNSSPISVDGAFYLDLRRDAPKPELHGFFHIFDGAILVPWSGRGVEKNGIFTCTYDGHAFSVPMQNIVKITNRHGGMLWECQSSAAV